MEIEKEYHMMAALITHSCINLGPLLADRQGKNPQELTNQLEDLRNSMQPTKRGYKKHGFGRSDFFSVQYNPSRP